MNSTKLNNYIRPLMNSLLFFVKKSYLKSSLMIPRSKVEEHNKGHKDHQEME